MPLLHILFGFKQSIHTYT